MDKKQREKENKSIEGVEKEIRSIPVWFNFLFYSGHFALVVIIGWLFGITASAIIMIAFSAFFTGYLFSAFTFSFSVATLAKTISMILGMTGIIILFISEGWWGLIGILGYYFLGIISVSYWSKHAEFKIK
jgi:hypothetical protein